VKEKNSVEMERFMKQAEKRPDKLASPVLQSSSTGKKTRGSPAKNLKSIEVTPRIL